jgi:hypothetical protein
LSDHVPLLCDALSVCRRGSREDRVLQPEHLPPSHVAVDALVPIASGAFVLACVGVMLARAMGWL